MSVITKMRKQDAVYWAPGAYDAYGQPTMGSATAITCRWEEIAEQFLDSENQVQVSNARVYVSQTVELGGMLWLGVIGSAPANPRADNDAWEIRKYESIPNFKATEFLKSALL